jgi:hypothetical protein
VMFSCEYKTRVYRWLMLCAQTSLLDSPPSKQTDSPSRRHPSLKSFDMCITPPPGVIPLLRFTSKVLTLNSADHDAASLPGRTEASQKEYLLAVACLGRAPSGSDRPERSSARRTEWKSAGSTAEAERSKSGPSIGPARKDGP